MARVRRVRTSNMIPTSYAASVRSRATLRAFAQIRSGLIPDRRTKRTSQAAMPLRVARARVASKERRDQCPRRSLTRRSRTGTGKCGRNSRNSSSSVSIKTSRRGTGWGWRTSIECLTQTTRSMSLKAPANQTWTWKRPATVTKLTLQLVPEMGLQRFH